MKSQPARMRCGKSVRVRQITNGANVATRANALWQICLHRRKIQMKHCRNPRECAVANHPAEYHGLRQSQSQPARMRCGKSATPTLARLAGKSQPARMRCGKSVVKAALLRYSVVATRANALWQIIVLSGRSQHRRVATRANALWQILMRNSTGRILKVATRANALWQMSAPINTVPRTSSRNPRECAVANVPNPNNKPCALKSQPARMRCGKCNRLMLPKGKLSSQPARMRCGKYQKPIFPFYQCWSQPARMRCGKWFNYKRHGIW